jgi:hypothetical protein
MPTRIRLVLHPEGVRELLHAPGVAGDLAARAGRIASQAGEGHEVVTGSGPNRAYARVLAVTYEAYFSEQIDRTLTRSIDAGR